MMNATCGVEIGGNAARNVGSCEKGKQSGLYNALARLEKRIDGVRERVAVLHDRLTPTLLPSVPHPEQTAKLVAHDAVCPIAERVNDFEEQLQVLHAELHDILERLDV